MTDYYPGSKKEKKQYPDSPHKKQPPPEIGEPFRMVRYKDKIIGTYTLGQLAKALGRKPVTLRRWESEGVIPVAPFELPGVDNRGRRRLYSTEHVEGIIEIAIAEGVINDLTKKIGDTKFKEKVLELFERLAKEL